MSSTAPASEYGLAEPEDHDPTSGRADLPKPKRSKATAGRSATSPAAMTGLQVKEPEPNPCNNATGGASVPAPSDSRCTAQPRWSTLLRWLR